MLSSVTIAACPPLLRSGVGVRNRFVDFVRYYVVLYDCQLIACDVACAMFLFWREFARFRSSLLFLDGSKGE